MSHAFKRVGVGVITACFAATATGGEPPVFENYSPTAERLVVKMLKAMSHLSTYSDDAVIKMVTGGPFNANDQAVSFTYAKSKRFRIRTEQHDIYSNGKELTVYAKSMRRYTVKRLKKDIGKQVEQYSGARGMNFTNGSIVLSSDPRKTFAGQFKDMDVDGNEDIDGDPCVRLSGVMEAAPMGLAESELPVTLFVRERDFIIRRAELDLMEMMKKQFDENSGLVVPFKEYKLVYDVRDLKVNEAVDEETFVFEPPAGAKKVAKFFASWMQPSDTAQQFELSGKAAPEFELETTDGTWVSNESLKGKVVVLEIPGQWLLNNPPGVSVLDEIRADYADKPVAVVLIHRRANADKLMENLENGGWEVTVALDPDASVPAAFFDEPAGAGIVIIGKDGIVQGRYAPILTEVTATALRGDIDKLLAGETLEGGKVMTEAEIEEAQEQKSSRFTFGATAEPLNEDDLYETWSIRAGGGRSFLFGSGSGGAGTGGDIWIRDKNVAERVESDGEITAEIELPDPSTDQFSQDQFVGGRLGARLGVVYMKTIPGESEQMGWRPPKEAQMHAVDASGRTLWEMKFEVKNNRVPSHLVLANLDGRAGDEFLFVHQGALWVVDHRGEVLVRKPIAGWVQWVRVEDRDHDRRAEVYVRTDRKLHRFDYRPR